MSTPITEQNFKNASMDADLIHWMQTQADGILLDPEEIELLAKDNVSVSTSHLLHHATTKIDKEFNDERVSLSHWSQDASTRRATAKANEERSRKELSKLEANGEKWADDGKVTHLGPGDNTKIWVSRGVSIILLVAGYVSMTTFLHEQMGWSWLSSVFLPLIGVLGVGLIIKAFFGVLAGKSQKGWSIAFFVSILLIVGLACCFFFFLSQEYGGSQKLIIIDDNTPAGSAVGDHGSAIRFYLGMLLEILSAGVAWAYSDHVIKEATKTNGTRLSDKWEAVAQHLAEAVKQEETYASRIAHAESLKAIIHSAEQRLQAEAVRQFQIAKVKLK
jgi:hypothetical protein